MSKARDIARAGTALSSVDATELGYLDGVTSNVQTQINAKLATATASSTYQPLVSGVSDTEIGYLDGVTSAIQTQLNTNASAASAAQTTADAALPKNNYFSAGKNKIINGDFGVWQRGTTSTASAGRYLADRFYFYTTNSVTCQRSTDVPTGQGFTYSASMAGSSGAMVIIQPYELPATGNAGVFGTGTWTFSLWMKVASGTESIAIDAYFADNVGGGNQVQLNSTLKTVTTSWQRFSVTFTGTAAAGTNTCIRFGLYSAAGISSTLTTTGWQVEAGSVATAFQTATGTIQGELAACQRYYYRTSSDSGYKMYGIGYASNANTLNVLIPFPVTMRTTPTGAETSAMASFYWEGIAGGNSPTSVTFGGSASAYNGQVVVIKTSGFTAGNVYCLFSNGGSGYIGFTAEL